MVEVLLLALLPPAGNFFGGLVAEMLPGSAAWRNRALHAAVGVVFAVVAVEIIPEALGKLAGWQIAAAFVTGGVIYLLAEALIEWRSGVGQSRMWMIYLAVATDLFGDGLMIGAGASVATSLGLVLAVGQVLADVPEGAASVFTFRANNVPRRRRLLLSASFVLPAVGAAAIAYLFLRGRPETWQLAALVGTAGLFAVAAFEDMIREAHASDDDSRISTLALLFGFAAFTVVSGGIG